MSSTERIVCFEGNSIMQEIISELRDVDIQKNRHRFRENLRLLGILMAYEISKELEYRHAEVETPLGIKCQKKLAEYPVIINVLRASNPLIEGFSHVFRESPVGFVAAARDEHTLEANIGYTAIPSLDNKDVIVPDVMLATGNSLIATLNLLEGFGRARQMFVHAVIAAPEGIRAVRERIPEARLYIGCIDERLNERGYIVPGLGDAGDLCFGEKFLQGKTG
ncbi:MAG: uracil phosphoribosyltransferase [Candidatus Woesearchaeota archaeon]